MGEAVAQQPDDVLVPTEVASALYAHLQEQGRATAFTSAADVYTKLGRVMEREWGTPNAKRFQDEPGGGWLVDISNYLDGEAIHVMIRTVHGRRTVTAFVDESEVDDFLEGKGWVTEAAKGLAPPGVDAAALAEAEAIEAGRQLPAARPGPAPAVAAVPAPVQAPGAQAAPQARPDDPAMVLVLEERPEGTPGIIHHERCTREEVPGVVKMLLRRGPDGRAPVAEEQIEIWSCVSKPKLEVRF